MHYAHNPYAPNVPATAHTATSPTAPHPDAGAAGTGGVTVFLGSSGTASSLPGSFVDAVDMSPSDHSPVGDDDDATTTTPAAAVPAAWTPHPLPFSGAGGTTSSPDGSISTDASFVSGVQSMGTYDATTHSSDVHPFSSRPLAAGAHFASACDAQRAVATRVRDALLPHLFSNIRGAFRVQAITYDTLQGSLVADRPPAAAVVAPDGSHVLPRLFFGQVPTYEDFDAALLTDIVWVVFGVQLHDAVRAVRHSAATVHPDHRNPYFHAHADAVDALFAVRSPHLVLLRRGFLVLVSCARRSAMCGSPPCNRDSCVWCRVRRAAEGWSCATREHNVPRHALQVRFSELPNDPAWHPQGYPVDKLPDVV